MHLEFTGERIVPGKVDDLLLAEHIARYEYVAHILAGGVALDIACGVGYGSRILRSGGAEQVVSFDLAADAVLYAATKHGGDGRLFFCGDAREIPLAGNSVDFITFFEAVEHLENPERVLKEAARILKPDGLLFISTPNSRLYRKQFGEERNPFHVREYDLTEFLELLKPYFGHTRCLGQSFVESVRFADWTDEEERAAVVEQRRLSLAETEQREPDYLLAACAHKEESLGRLREMELRSSYNVMAYFRETIRKLEKDLNEKRTWAMKLDTEVQQLRRRHAEVEKELDDRSAWAMSLQRQLSEQAQPLAMSAEGGEIEERETDTGLKAGLEAMARQAGELPQVLIVASGPVDETLAVADLMAEKVTPGALHGFVGSPQDWALRDYCEAHELPFIEVGPSVGDLREAVSELRKADILYYCVILGRHSTHRRMKLLGLSLDRHRLLVFNENRDFFSFSLDALLKYLAWRGRESMRQKAQLALAGARLFWDQGFSAFRERFMARRRGGRAARAVERLKLRAATMVSGKIALTDFDEPAVSIVIPAHNQWSFTLRCLRSIAENTHVPHEVILVDNASTDKTGKAEKIVSGLKVVRLADNDGFVGACNRGAERASGRYILLLNNDIVTTPGWLQPMVQVFDRDSRAGAVGSKLLYPDGRLQEAGGIVWRNGEAWNYGKGDDPELPEYCYLREVDYCSGAALMVRRDLWLQLGGLSREFHPGYWEDADLCFSIRNSGFKVLFQPRSLLYHFEGASSGRDEDRGMKKYQRINAGKFRKKWQHQFAAQEPLDPRNLFLARDRNRKPTVLVIDHYVPTYDRDAGSAFMFRLVRALATGGYRVIFWPDNRFNTPFYCGRLQEQGVEVRYGATTFAEYLRSHARFIDHAIIYRASIAESYLAELRGKVASVAYIAVDLEHVREARRGELEETAPDLVENLRQREDRIVTQVDSVAAHSTVELDVLHDEFAVPREKLHLLPLPVLESEVTESGFDERRDLAFVGSTHPPNVDAVRYFVDDVLPTVRESLGDVRLRVIGEVSRTLSDLATEPGVELCGFVDALAAALNEVRVFVAPIRYGAGIKGKILTAMAMGVPVVTSTMGIEGIDLSPGDDVLIADDSEAMAEAVIRLYTDPTEWMRLRENGMRWIESSQSDDQFRSRVETFMNDLQQASESQPTPAIAEEASDVGSDPAKALAQS